MASTSVGPHGTIIIIAQTLSSFPSRTHNSKLGSFQAYIFSSVWISSAAHLNDNKTIDILFSKGAFQSIQTLQASHAAEILASIKLELKGSKDIVKIMAGISVLGHLALLPGSVGLQAISQLLMFLGHRYPKVRKACSEQVYLLLVQRGEELLQPDDLEAAQELVSESCWDGPLENLSKERQVLASMFKLQNEVKELTESDDPGKLVSRRWAVRDENASYAALVSENR